MSLSKIVVSGRVIRAPEKRFTPNTNVAVTEFAIAVESQPRQDGQVESTPVKVITWRELAERCSQEIKKGDMVAVDGRLQIHNYQTSDGQRRRDVEVDAVAVENISLVMGASAPAEEGSSPALARAGARPAAKPAAAAAKTDDLDSFFSEDEIPF